MVADGRGDVAALDCVSYAHLHRCDAALVAQLRILDWTPASPSLPLISSRAIDERTRQALIGALGAVLADPRLKDHCANLLLAGFDFRVDESFREMLDHERRAEELGYPVLY